MMNAIIHNDIVRAINNGYILVFVLLDLISAFDAFNHAVLLEVLEENFDINAELKWFRLYLSDRTQSCVVSHTPAGHLISSVPQRWVIDSQMFVESVRMSIS